MKTTLRIVLGFAVCAGIARAGDWAAWRGPTGQGHSTETNLPLKWGGKDNLNVKWKTPLADAGNSTPVIWKDKIFLTQATKGGNTRSLLCLQRGDGKLLWEQKVDYPDKERVWNPTYYSSASPCVDAERVVVSQGSAGMYCYDHSGKLLWKRDDLGKWEHVYGNASSPQFYKETVILWCGPDAKNNYLLAVEKSTGKTVWKTEEKGGSWGTPLLVQIDGKDQLLIGVPKRLKSFDPNTGKELWFCDGLTDLVYTSPLYNNGVVVAMSGYGGAALAVKTGGAGDVTKDRLWLHPRNIQRVGSGVIVGEHVYMLEEDGTPHCYELSSGKQIWEAPSLKSRTWGSIVHADNRLYVFCQNGDTQVFAASPKYEHLATNRLGDGGANASVVPYDGELFLRTFKHLWCISEKK